MLSRLRSRSSQVLKRVIQPIKRKVVKRAIISTTAIVTTAIVYQYHRNKHSNSQSKSTVFNLVCPTSTSEKTWTPRKPNTDLDQFGGSEEILNSLAETVRYLQNPEAFTKSGIKAPRGVILSGPPGGGR